MGSLTLAAIAFAFVCICAFQPFPRAPTSQ